MQPTSPDAPSPVTPQRVHAVADRAYYEGRFEEAELLHDAADQLERTEANEFNAIWVINKHLAGTDEVSTFNDAMEIVRKTGRKLERDAEGQWQPIETAPRDGTKVLLAWPGIINMGRYAPDFAGFIAVNTGTCFYPDQPTHWQPIPAPPEAK